MTHLREVRRDSKRRPMAAQYFRPKSEVAETIVGLLMPLLLLATPVGAQSLDAEVLSHSERGWVASKMYAVASHHFAHWEGVPDLDLDDWYQTYLAKAMSAKNRKEFSFASMEFIAGLRNGHSVFIDERLDEEFGRPLGFQLARLQGRWIVTASRLENLDVGEDVVGIDNETMDTFFDRQQRFIYGSSERIRERRLFFMEFLFPESFLLVLRSGIRFPIDPKNQTLLKSEAGSAPEPKTLKNGVVYLPIRSCSKPEFEQQTIDHITRHRDAPTMIIDVRHNGGGSTPSNLIEALMDRPWSDWVSATPHLVGVESAYAHLFRSMPLEQFGERTRGYIEALGASERSMLAKYSPLRQPVDPVFKNNLIILIDEGCASACEDFVMPLKFYKRATVIGRPIGGSSGQPYIYNFGNGMQFLIGTKRQYFPDGSAFEGVGILPDINVPRTLDSLLSDADETLVTAMQVAQSTAP